jgi:hypothetical protein
MWRERRTFWVVKKAERRERRAVMRERMRRKRFIETELAGPSMIDKNDDRCHGLILTREESSRAESSDNKYFFSKIM